MGEPYEEDEGETTAAPGGEVGEDAKKYPPVPFLSEDAVGPCPMSLEYVLVGVSIGRRPGGTSSPATPAPSGSMAGCIMQ